MPFLLHVQVTSESLESGQIERKRIQTLSLIGELLKICEHVLELLSGIREDCLTLLPSLVLNVWWALLKRSLILIL